MIGDAVPALIVSKLDYETEATRIKVGEDEILYIHVKLDNPNGLSTQNLERISKTVRVAFEKVLPETLIVVGFYELRFTSISKKEEFANKLAGDLPPS